jgi:hypothetical protein
VLQVHSAIAVTIAGGWALPFRRRAFDVWVWRSALVRRCASEISRIVVDGCLRP